MGACFTIWLKQQQNVLEKQIETQRAKTDAASEAKRIDEYKRNINKLETLQKLDTGLIDSQKNLSVKQHIALNNLQTISKREKKNLILQTKVVHATELLVYPLNDLKGTVILSGKLTGTEKAKVDSIGDILEANIKLNPQIFSVTDFNYEKKSDKYVGMVNLDSDSVERHRLMSVKTPQRQLYQMIHRFFVPSMGLMFKDPKTFLNLGEIAFHDNSYKLYLDFFDNSFLLTAIDSNFSFSFVNNGFEKIKSLKNLQNAIVTIDYQFGLKKSCTNLNIASLELTTPNSFRILTGHKKENYFVCHVQED